jgi:DNA helicase-2/ATP-dependent DNA helicase PcrA
VAEADPDEDDDDLDLVAQAQVDSWDAEIAHLLAEARRDRSDAVEVVLPSSLSATAVARLRDDPDGFARELARPMPRPPSPAARFGTRFHAWVETRFGQQALLDTDELADRGDADVADDAELAELIELFERGGFADRAPFAVEAPFALVLAGQVVRGRIDAVYESDGGFLVVDWKTNRQQDADALQLSLYRLAWAELRGVPVETVRAGFYYVRDQQLVEPPLLDRAELEQIVVPRLEG